MRKNKSIIYYLHRKKKEICRYFKNKKCIWLIDISNNTNYSNNEIPF